MKFFHDLDAILQSEPTAQLTEEKDGNSKCPATLSSVTAPEIEEDRDPVRRNRRNRWLERS